MWWRERNPPHICGKDKKDIPESGAGAVSVWRGAAFGGQDAGHPAAGHPDAGQGRDGDGEEAAGEGLGDRDHLRHRPGGFRIPGLWCRGFPLSGKALWRQ